MEIIVEDDGHEKVVEMRKEKIAKWESYLQERARRDELHGITGVRDKETA